METKDQPLHASTSEAVTNNVRVEVESQYAPEHSQPFQNHWFFYYTIRITNEGEATVQLLSRHWIATDAAGHYAFTTLAPDSASGGRPPFFAIVVFARGLLNRLFTRAYLPDADLGADPLLSTIDVGRRVTLLCVAESDSGRTVYRFDIHLQGPRETVFLAYRDDGR